MDDFQYLTDQYGVRTAVIVPINEWNRLAKYFVELKKLDEIEESIKEGMCEVGEIEIGEKIPASTNDFLNEL